MKFIKCSISGIHYNYTASVFKRSIYTKQIKQEALDLILSHSLHHIQHKRMKNLPQLFDN